MAENKQKISDLQSIQLPPQDDDFLVLARSEIANYKIRYEDFSRMYSGLFLGVKPGINNLINDNSQVNYIIEKDVKFEQKTEFDLPISGNLSGTARYTQDAVYITGDQQIDGIKTFTNYLVGNLSGEATSVRSGVYISGDQTISGIINFADGITINGEPFDADIDPDEVLTITGLEQVVTGSKIFYNFLIPSGGITTTGDNTIFTIAR